MHKLWLLVGVQLKDIFSRSRNQVQKGKRIMSLLLLLSPLLAILPVVVMIGLIHDGFVTIGLPSLTLTYVYAAASLIGFVFAIPLIVAFFFSKDLSLLATLPLKPQTIVWSKAVAVYAYIFPFTTALMGSGIGFYIHTIGFSWGLVLPSLVSLFLLPLAPMALGVLLILPFMSLIGGSRHRNLMIILGNLALLGFILALQTGISNAAREPGRIAALLAEKDGLLQLVGNGFPPSVWITRFFLGDGIQALYLIAIALVSLALIQVLATFFFAKALMEYNQKGNGGRKGAVTYRRSKVLTLLVRRHLGIIFHNPTFLLNAVLTLFVPVILFVMYSFMGIMDMETLRSPLLEPYRLYILVGILLSPSIMGSLSATVISREGPAFWETRALPISIRDNLRSRHLSSLVLNFMGQLLLAPFVVWLLSPSLWELLLALGVMTAGTLSMSVLDLLINLRRPYIQWANPTAAVKNNLNVLTSLGSRVLLGLVAYGIYRLLPGGAPWVVVLLVGVFFFLTWQGAGWFLYHRGALIFRDMDL